MTPNDPQSPPSQGHKENPEKKPLNLPPCLPGCQYSDPQQASHSAECELNRAVTAWSQAAYRLPSVDTNTPGLLRAIGWIDHYLVMRLEPSAAGVLGELRKRLVHELANGPLTSVEMEIGRSKP